MAQYQLEAAHFHKPSNAPNNSNPLHATGLNPPAPKALGSEIGKRKGELKERERREAAPWDDAGNPSQEASNDPAPTRHAPEDEAQKSKEKSKYEASDVFRSRKGDRFS
jgi:hypothetical protein